MRYGTKDAQRGGRRMSDSITIILTQQEAVAASAVILASGHHGHRPAALESVRQKLRAGLDHRVKDQEEHEAEARIIAHEYKRRGCDWHADPLDIIELHETESSAYDGPRD